jgi:hypothetical protein
VSKSIFQEKRGLYIDDALIELIKICAKKKGPTKLHKKGHNEIEAKRVIQNVHVKIGGG